MVCGGSILGPYASSKYDGRHLINPQLCELDEKVVGALGLMRRLMQGKRTYVLTWVSTEGPC